MSGKLISDKKIFKKPIDKPGLPCYNVINLKKGDLKVLYEYVIRGCVCHLSAETIEVLEEERKAIEDERTAWEAMHKAYQIACTTNDPMDWSIYSDLYKDCYGVRPRY